MIKELTLNEFQKRALATTNRDLTHAEALLNGSLGLAGEAGEFADAVKKLTFHGKTLDTDSYEHLIEELGDVLFYVAWLADTLGMDLETVARKNNLKLSLRYPTGFVPVSKMTKLVGSIDALNAALVALKAEEEGSDND